MKMVVSNMAWVPLNQIMLDRAKGIYEAKLYEDRACQKCDFAADRHCDMCDECPAYLEHIKLWKVKEDKQGRRWLGVPKGDKKRLNLFAGDKKVEVIDKRAVVPMRHLIKFTGKLKPEQRDAIRQLDKAGNNGVLKAPPRSGKCVIGSTLVATSAGIVPIQDLFKDESREVSGLHVSIATEHGPRSTWVKYQKVVDRTIKVRTAHGYHVHGTPNHPMRVATPEGLVWKPLEDIQPGDKLLISSTPMYSSRTVKSAKGVITPKQAEAVGYLLACAEWAPITEHSLVKLVFHSQAAALKGGAAVKDLVNSLADSVYEFKPEGSAVRGIGVTGVEIIKFLNHSFGLRRVPETLKEIPEAILKSKKEIVHGFLRGFLEGIVKPGEPLILYSEKLADQIHLLLTMMGCPGRKVTNGKSHTLEYDKKLYNKRVAALLKLVNLPNLMEEPLFQEGLIPRQPPITYLTEVVKKEEFIEPIKVYDVSVPETKSFIANGLVSHNTVMATYQICQLQQKTLVLAAQYDWLKGFYDTFMGSDHQAALTNAGELLTPSVGFCKKPSDFDTYDVCLATYQSLGVGDAKTKLANVRGKFGLVVIDECFTGSHRVQTRTGLKTLHELYDKAQTVDVLAFNHNSNQVEFRPLISRTSKVVTQLCQIFMSNGAKFICTPNHMWWDIDSSQYVPASDLNGRHVMGLMGNSLLVTSVELVEVPPTTVYDMGVQEHHNYFVFPPDSDKGVLVHNCHDTAATVYSKVVTHLNPRYMIGLSGTPDRKDNKYQMVTEPILGRVVADIKVETLVPTVEIVETPASTHYNYKIWAYAMQFLRKHEKRNKLIVENAVADIKAGHSIVIPVGSIAHGELLTEAINDAFPNRKHPIAVFFSGKLNKKHRDEALDAARSGKIRCVVGIRKIVQVGINVPRWSCLYVVEPISNPPKSEQETARIRTQMEGKKPPLVKIFLEDFPQSKGCFRTLWFQTIKRLKFKVHPAVEKIAYKYIKDDRRRGQSRGGIVFNSNRDDTDNFLI